MTRLSLIRTLLVAVLLSAIAAFAFPRIESGSVVDFSNCATGGSAAQSISDGSYLMVVFDEETTLCWAATCASGGRRLPLPFAMLMDFKSASGSQQLSCRSAGATGDVHFTRIF